MKQYVLNKTNAPSKAIRLKCSDCIYDSSIKGEGGELTQITNCNDISCSLWEHRPLTSDVKNLMKEEKMSLMTSEELAVYKEKARIAGERMDSMRKSGSI